MEQVGYPNCYKDVNEPLEKTIRYRQMVGLLTSSSIRSFQKTQSTNDTSTQQQQTETTDHTNENDTDKATLQCNMDQDTSTSANDLVKTISTTLIALDAAVTTGSSTEQPTSILKRNSKRKRTPIAVDVVQYLFHNNNNNNNDGDTVPNANVKSLSSMKQQQQQQDLKRSTKFKMQFHHPGYVPTSLWQNFDKYETNDKSQSTEKESQIQDTYHNNIDRIADANNNIHLQFMPVCFDCGGVIQPGVRNTTIRMVDSKQRSTTGSKTEYDANTDVTAAVGGTMEVTTDLELQSSRTKRRRESRFKAKLFRKQYYGSKQHQQQQQLQQQKQMMNHKVPTSMTYHKSLHPHSKSNIWQYIWQQQNKYYHNQPTTSQKDLKSIYPFLNCCSHYYIITCGSCGVQIYIPDFQESNTKSINIRNQKINAKSNQLQKNSSAGQNQKSTKGMNHDKITKRPVPTPLEDMTMPSLASNTVVKQHQIVCSTTNDTIEVISNQSSTNNSRLPNISTTLMDSINSITASTTSTTTGVKRKEVDVQPQLKSQQPLVSTTITTLHSQQRKKKKSKNVQGKNDLMSFLSSLNDR